VVITHTDGTEITTVDRAVTKTELQADGSWRTTTTTTSKPVAVLKLLHQKAWWHMSEFGLAEATPMKAKIEAATARCAATMGPGTLCIYHGLGF
jgi:hypothetical protein